MNMEKYLQRNFLYFLLVALVGIQFGMFGAAAAYLILFFVMKPKNWFDLGGK